jgi:protein TonB
MLDILFEHRNKLYGAYALRKTYSNRLGKSLGIALTIVLAFVSFSFIKNKKGSNGPTIESGAFIIKNVDLEKEEIKQPEKKEQLPPKSTADYHPPVIVPDDKVKKDLPDIDKISTSVIGDEDIEGIPDDGAGQQTSENNGGGEGTVKEEPTEVKQPDLPSYPPKFPGGDAAWLAFLQRHLQSPEDLEPGQKVQVLVRFWVDVDGSVSRAEVVKSGGSSFDKEVLRVLKKMPKWEPAMQYGNRVAVAYSQPVTFMGVEE